MTLQRLTPHAARGSEALRSSLGSLLPLPLRAPGARRHRCLRPFGQQTGSQPVIIAGFTVSPRKETTTGAIRPRGPQHAAHTGRAGPGPRPGASPPTPARTTRLLPRAPLALSRRSRALPPQRNPVTPCRSLPT